MRIMKKVHPPQKLDPLDVETAVELSVGGLIALMLMRWFGM